MQYRHTIRIRVISMWPSLLEWRPSSQWQFASAVTPEYRGPDTRKSRLRVSDRPHPGSNIVMNIRARTQDVSVWSSQFRPTRMRDILVCKCILCVQMTGRPVSSIRGRGRRRLLNVDLKIIVTGSGYNTRIIITVILIVYYYYMGNEYKTNRVLELIATAAASSSAPPVNVMRVRPSDARHRLRSKSQQRCPEYRV